MAFALKWGRRVGHKLRTRSVQAEEQDEEYDYDADLEPVVIRDENKKLDVAALQQREESEIIKITHDLNDDDVTHNAIKKKEETLEDRVEKLEKKWRKQEKKWAVSEVNSWQENAVKKLVVKRKKPALEIPLLSKEKTKVKAILQPPIVDFKERMIAKKCQEIARTEEAE